MRQKNVHDSERPAVGRQVITACAFIHSRVDGMEKVFVAKRALTKKFMPGVYELPGGHIDFGEDIVAGLKREVFEEFRMKVNVGDPFAVFDYVNDVKGSHSIEIIYFATFIDPIENIIIDSEYHSTCSWFTEDDLSKMFSKEKRETDQEYQAIYRGFALLKDSSLNFG